MQLAGTNMDIKAYNDKPGQRFGKGLFHIKTWMSKIIISTVINLLNFCTI